MSDVTSRVRRVAEQVDAGYDAARTSAALARLHAGLRKRRARRVLGVGMVGVLCLIAAALWSLRPAREVARQVPVKAPRPDVLFSLRDGSTVTTKELGGQVVAQLVSPNQVKLALVAGSAEFDVTPNPEREFRVSAGQVAVVVLGTKFSVSLRGDHARVEVERGRVRVEWERGQQILTPGERGTFPPTEGPGAPTPPAEPQETTPEPTEAPEPVAAPLGRAPRAEVDWRVLARRGGFASAYGMLHDKVRAVALTDMDDLWLAADVARGAGHAAEAVPYLKRAITLHGSDARAAVAAFTLGRVRQTELADPAGAAVAFAQSRSIAPTGPLAENALAREVECWSQAGDTTRARTLAEEYIKRWPSGSRARTVRRFGGLP